MLEHQRLQLSIVGSAPELPFQECEPDLDFAFLRFQIVIARAPDDSAGLTIDHDQRAPGGEAAVKISLEDLAFVAIRFRMLLPDEWITGGMEECVEVLGFERTKLDQISL